jgi:hypothetical protein
MRFLKGLRTSSCSRGYVETVDPAGGVYCSVHDSVDEEADEPRGGAQTDPDGVVSLELVVRLPGVTDIQDVIVDVGPR